MQSDFDVIAQITVRQHRNGQISIGSPSRNLVESENVAKELLRLGLEAIKGRENKEKLLSGKMVIIPAYDVRDAVPRPKHYVLGADTARIGCIGSGS